MTERNVFDENTKMALKVLGRWSMLVIVKLA